MGGGMMGGRRIVMVSRTSWLESVLLFLLKGNKRDLLIMAFETINFMLWSSGVQGHLDIGLEQHMVVSQQAIIKADSCFVEIELKELGSQ
jgi:hypothetical protein